MHPVRDHYLPPDPAAFRASRPPGGRVIVIAPTRAACETIELAMGLEVRTVLEAEHGEELRELAASGDGFGIVAATGTGKTLGIRPIAETILGSPFRYGVVNREREATPETPSWQLVIVTTGIARRWFQDELIARRDTLVVDEIHQTSAELELCLALGKRVGCRFIWLSATVDPAFYARYLDSRAVLETSAFDPGKAADVRVVARSLREWLDAAFLRRVVRRRRGVAVFVPTRAEVEEVAADIGSQWPALHTAYYHGGEPIRVIRPFLDGSVPKPFLLAMTAAGQSALNVRGLDTVVLLDARYQNEVRGGRNVLSRMHLGANDILQMAGRVHGRVSGGEVVILSERDLDFDALRPGPPELQLAGDAERVALTCAALGVDAGDLELPAPLDAGAYRAAVSGLEARGLVRDGRLTAYGAEVEALPVERPWAELLVHADEDLVPLLAAMASIESLHRMTREERELRGVIVPGSDHLTAYNIYAEAVNRHGEIGLVYGLPRHVFRPSVGEWEDGRGVLIKAVEDAALGFASVYRALEREIPARLPHAGEGFLRRFQELLARIMPFDLVMDEETSTGEEARVARGSVCGVWGAVAGTLRYFADRFGNPRAAIEGTQLPYDLVRRYAVHDAPQVVYDAGRRRAPLAIGRAVRYRGFVLDRQVEPIDAFPDGLDGSARAALVEALMTGRAAHRDAGQLRRTLVRLGELYRRAGGHLPAADGSSVRAAIGRRLQSVSSHTAFLRTDLDLSLDEFVPADRRRELEALPAALTVGGERCPLDYDIEDGRAVLRLRLKERQAARLQASDLQGLDRPVRFTVTRGKRVAVRADSLEELEAALGARGRRRSGGSPGGRRRRGKHGRRR